MDEGPKAHPLHDAADLVMNHEAIMREGAVGVQEDVENVSQGENLFRDRAGLRARARLGGF